MFTLPTKSLPRQDTIVRPPQEPPKDQSILDFYGRPSAPSGDVLLNQGTGIVVPDIPIVSTDAKTRASRTFTDKDYPPEEERISYRRKNAR